MPSHDPFPSIHAESLYCTFEDERVEEPEFIVDPLSGFVVAIVPARSQSIWQRRPSRSAREAPSPWWDRLRRWLRLGGAAMTLLRAAIRPTLKRVPTLRRR